jgi:hypothetical protein
LPHGGGPPEDLTHSRLVKFGPESQEILAPWPTDCRRKIGIFGGHFDLERSLDRFDGAIFLGSPAIGSLVKRPFLNDRRIFAGFESFAPFDRKGNFRRAGFGVLGEKAVDSILKELTSIDGKGVFEPHKLDELSANQKRALIRGFIFLKEKFKPDGSFDKLKARLVGGGHLQDRSLYADDEINSPTASLQSVFMVATLAAQESRKVMTMDIGSAYLNADMQKEANVATKSKDTRVAYIGFRCVKDRPS